MEQHGEDCEDRVGALRVVVPLSFVAVITTTFPLSGLSASDTAPTGVRTTGRTEKQSAVGEDAFAWSEDSRRRRFHFNLFVKPGGSPRFKVNPRGTQAFAGDIEGAYARVSPALEVPQERHQVLAPRHRRAQRARRGEHQEELRVPGLGFWRLGFSSWVSPTPPRDTRELSTQLAASQLVMASSF
jgi:hypothetical protein